MLRLNVYLQRNCLWVELWAKPFGAWFQNRASNRSSLGTNFPLRRSTRSYHFSNFRFCLIPQLKLGSKLAKCSYLGPEGRRRNNGNHSSKKIHHKIRLIAFFGQTVHESTRTSTSATGTAHFNESLSLLLKSSGCLGPVDTQTRRSFSR
jgi:hypothetical protein